MRALIAVIVGMTTFLVSAYMWWRAEKRMAARAARAAAFAAVLRVRAGPCVDVLRMQPSHRPAIRMVRP